MKAVSSVILCFLVTLCIFAPLNIYLANQGEFLLSVRDVLANGFLAAAVLAVPLFLLCFFLKGRARERAVSALLALSILLWLQGNIFVWRYGPLDGRRIDWSAQWANSIIDSIVWCMVLAMSVIRTSFFVKISGPVSAFLIVTQLVSTAVSSAALRDSSFDFKRYDFDESAKFDLSGEKNVILLVLDEFQSNFFQEAVAADKALSRNFDGFVYFRNAVGAFNITELAMPAILTGEYYDNKEKRWDFFKRVFTGRSVLKTLTQNGYAVELYPFKGWAYRMLYADPSICANLKKREVSSSEKRSEALFLYDLALFRYLPHNLKRLIYNDRYWLLTWLASDKIPRTPEHADLKFFETAENGVRAAGNEKRFKYYHLFGLHTPLEMDENLKVTKGLRYNRQNALSQSKAYAKLCGLFFDLLKKNGVYDDSLILVIGDHGCGRNRSLFIEPVPDQRSGKSSGVSHGLMARGIPLIMTKRCNARGELTVSEAPVSLSDIPATICRELGIEAGFPGESFFEIKEDASRIRYYGAAQWFEDPAGFFKPITRFKVSGHSWRSGSWSVDSILYPKGATEPLWKKKWVMDEEP